MRPSICVHLHKLGGSHTLYNIILKYRYVRTSSVSIWGLQDITFTDVELHLPECGPAS